MASPPAVCGDVASATADPLFRDGEDDVLRLTRKSLAYIRCAGLSGPIATKPWVRYVLDFAGPMPNASVPNARALEYDCRRTDDGLAPAA